MEGRMVGEKRRGKIKWKKGKIEGCTDEEERAEGRETRKLAKQ